MLTELWQDYCVLRLDELNCSALIANTFTATATTTGNLYKLEKAINQVSSTAFVASPRLWHERLGHVDPPGI